jgi:hypothetical protein
MEAFDYLLHLSTEIGSGFTDAASLRDAHAAMVDMNEDCGTSIVVKTGPIAHPSFTQREGRLAA